MRTLLFILFAILLCPLQSKASKVVVHELEYPGHVHPFLSQTPNGQAMCQLVYSRLIQLNHATSQPEPFLAEELPLVEFISEGELRGGMKITYKLRADAEWAKGVPVTYDDVLFTYKMLFNPQKKHALPHPFYSSFRGITQDETDPLKFSVYTQHTSILAPYYFGFWVLPKRVMDPENFSDKFDLVDFFNPEKQKELVQNMDFNSLTASFYNQSPGDLVQRKFSTGPYQMLEYNTDMWYGPIRFGKKENWWGEKHKSLSVFAAKPKEIIYKIYDWDYALKKWKEGELDVVRGIPPERLAEFKEKNHKKVSENKMARYNYEFLIFNQDNPILKSNAVRRAFKLAISKTNIVDQVFNGEVGLVSGPITNHKPYFLDQNRKSSIEEAKQILIKDGWFDSDGDEVLDRAVGRNREKLSLNLVYNFLSEDRERVAISIVKDLKDLGVEVKIQTRSWRDLVSQLGEKRFEMALMGWAAPTWEDDLIPQFHSSMIGSSNITGTDNPALDSLLQTAMITFETEKRFEYYQAIQAKIAAITPAVYLYHPWNNLLFSKRLYGSEMVPNRLGFEVTQLKIKG